MAKQIIPGRDGSVTIVSDNAALFGEIRSARRRPRGSYKVAPGHVGWGRRPASVTRDARRAAGLAAFRVSEATNQATCGAILLERFAALPRGVSQRARSMLTPDPRILPARLPRK